MKTSSCVWTALLILGFAASAAFAQRTCTIVVKGKTKRHGEYTVATEMGRPQITVVDFRPIRILPGDKDEVARQIADNLANDPITGVLSATATGNEVTVVLEDNASLACWESVDVEGIFFEERPCEGEYQGGRSKARVRVSARRIVVGDGDRVPRRLDWSVENAIDDPLPDGFEVTWQEQNIVFVDGQSSGNLGGLPPGERRDFTAHVRLRSNITGVIERGRAWARPNTDPALDDPALDPYELSEGVTEESCITGPRPAATLLFPYFEVDLDDPEGVDTFVSVTNASDRCALVRMTLWTDLGIPTLTFYVNLSPKDVQALDLRRVLAGQLPRTSDVLFDPQCPVLDFLPCEPEELDRALDPQEVESLLADHTGAPNPSSGRCAGVDHGDNVARGYVTADTTFNCTFPPTVATHTFYLEQVNDPEILFFSTHNQLWGDYFYVDPGDNFAQSETAVHLVADPGRFVAGDYTFYGRYVDFDASDARVPLSGAYGTRFLNGGVFDGTDFLVWRDTRSADLEPPACGMLPEWAPLEQRQVDGFNENEVFFELGDEPLFPWATQRLSSGELDIPVLFGWLSLDLWHGGGTPAQAWVTPVITAGGRFSVAHGAVPLDDLCREPPP